MKLWILLAFHDECTDFLGAFSTMEKAYEYMCKNFPFILNEIDDASFNYISNTNQYFTSSYVTFKIFTTEIDKPEMSE